MELLHHITLDAELADNLLHDTAACRHVADMEMYVSIMVFTEVINTSIGTDVEAAVGGGHMDVVEAHGLVVARQGGLQREGYREVGEHGGKGLRYLLEQRLARDG